jgi:hypothetical protein
VSVLEEIGTGGVDQPVRMRFRRRIRDYPDSEEKECYRRPG